MTMTVVTALMKASSVIHNTKLVLQKNLVAKTLSVYGKSISAMEKMIAVTIQTK